MRPPRPEDYTTDEEYLEAMDAYEAELFHKEDEAMERYYENARPWEAPTR